MQAMTSGWLRVGVVVSVYLGLWAPGAVAQLPPDSGIARILRERVESGRSAGIVLGLIDGRGRQHVIVWPEADPAGRAIDRNTVFEIGSITKTFTGIALADMVGRGEVALDDAVARYLPTDVTVPGRAGKQVSLLDLTTHSSGLPNMPSNFHPADPENPYADYTQAQLAEFLRGYVLPREIGARFEYSNLGGVLLGQALARREHAGYEDLVRRRVLEPLGMNHTRVMLTPQMRARLVPGHDASMNVVPNWDLATFTPAGGFRSDLDDMLRFLEANLRPPATPLGRAIRESHIPRRLVAADGGSCTASAAWCSQIALNWITYSENGDTVIYHPGETGGYHAVIAFNPASKMGVVILSNSRTRIDDIALHLLMKSSPLDGPPPWLAERHEIAAQPAILKRFEGTYEFAPGERVGVQLAGGKLFARFDMQVVQLHPESDQAFFLYESDTRIRFETDAHGLVTGLVQTRGGEEGRARKLM